MAKAKTPFELTIVYEPYERFASNGVTKTYKGKDELAVLKKIVNNHGYGVPDDMDEPVTAKFLWNEINETNGDGCDYISAFFVGKSKKYKGPKA